MRCNNCLEVSSTEYMPVFAKGGHSPCKKCSKCPRRPPQRNLPSTFHHRWSVNENLTIHPDTKRSSTKTKMALLAYHTSTKTSSKWTMPTLNCEIDHSAPEKNAPRLGTATSTSAQFENSIKTLQSLNHPFPSPKTNNRKRPKKNQTS